MKNVGSIVINKYEPVTDPEWERVDGSTRRQFHQFAAQAAERIYREQLRRGIGADGSPLARVPRGHRHDRASGPPLSPHQARSRTQRWLRVSFDVRASRLTLWWLNGWGRVLAAHAHKGEHDAEGNRLPVRDVLGLAPAFRRRWEGEVRSWWLRRRPGAGRSALPERHPLRRPRPGPAPLAARPKPTNQRISVRL